MRTLKLLGLLLTYPNDALIAALPELRQALKDDDLLRGQPLHDAEALLSHLGSRDLMTLQEDYVDLFDRARRLSLHLYEHLYGESRDRGQAMARLSLVYRMHGYDHYARELPDFLPLFSEFLSLVDVKSARSMLADAAAVLEALRLRLTERKSPYAAVPAALLAIADKTIDRAVLAEILARHVAGDSDPDDPDADWEEKPVTFGPGSVQVGRPPVRDGGCAGPKGEWS